MRADTAAAKIPRSAWQRLSCGHGAKGHRRYDWALIATTGPAHQLLVRRSLHKPTELAFYLCHSTGPAALPRLVQVAGTRWTIEECFQTAKNEAALDHYQVRLYPAWYRYVTLAMLALAFLAVARAAITDQADPPDDDQPAPQRPFPISANEIRRLFTALTRPPTDHHHIQHWFRWRLRHQARARRCHYQRQHT